MLTYDEFSKRCQVIFKTIFWLFWKLLSYLVCVANFKSINKSYLSRKKYDGGYFQSHAPMGIGLIELSDTVVWMGLIELTEPSDTLNYKLFFKHCILQTILHVFFLFIFVWNKILCSKNWAVFYIFLIWLGVAFGVTVLKFLCSWCSFNEVIGN